MSDEVLGSVATYYAARLREHGETARGVDWNSEDSQRLRFLKLLELCRADTTAYSLLDYGCGYGALLDHLAVLGRTGRYTGYDVAPEMVAAAQGRHAARDGATFTGSDATLAPHDYVLASGIFNVKLETPAAAWHDHVLRTLDRLNALARRGFAFNLLSLYSDPGLRREKLYYGDPRELFDHCKRLYSPRVALLHDYPLYEFTILVRREDP